MAVTPPGFADLSNASTARPVVARAGSPLSLALRAPCLVIALACAALALAIASAHPLSPAIAMGGFVAWALFATLRFSLAWPALIALVPVLGLAPLTGWIVFEEIDLVVLATAAGGYAALALGAVPAAGEPRVRPKLSAATIILLAFFLVSQVVALVTAISAAPATPFAWSAGYDSWENGLRLFKSFAFACLLLPLFVNELRRPDGFDRLAIAMTLSLGLGALLVVRERLQFSGLLEFSDDYRVTGGFWEMHVGGAALDGFLALTLPFAVREALRPAHGMRFGIALVALALAAYACLVTFSRGVYAAIPISLVVAGVLVARQRESGARAFTWTMMAKAAAFASVVAVGTFVVFRSGGYRAAGAFFVVLAIAMPVDRALRRLDVAGTLAAVIAAIVVAGAGVAVATLLPKGPYVVFVIAFLGCVGATLQVERGSRRSTNLLLVACWLWAAIAAVGVASNWGGAGALRDSGVVVALLVAAVAVLSRLPRPIWPSERRERIVTVALAGGVLAAVVTLTAGAYMANRFSTSGDDLRTRLSHWRDGLDRLHGVDWLTGKGLGRFYATSLAEKGGPEVPGFFAVQRTPSGTALVLAAPQVRYLAFYELMRVTQRVELAPGTDYDMRITLRTPVRNGVHAEVCEKQLLYAAACQSFESLAPVSSDTFGVIDFRFNSQTIGITHALGRRSAFLAIAANDPGGVLEVQRVQLLAPDGRDLVVNGRFTDGTTRWFSSSDRLHLPWHMKNIALGVLFDQGVIGLALFAALIGVVLFRTGLGGARRHPEAPFIAAAIAGYLAIGVFDTLLDVPRGALLFWLVVLAGLMLRNPRAVAAAPPSTDDTAREEREREERRLRRQNAFGQRRRAT